MGLIVGSKVKAYLKSKGKRTSKDALAALDDAVKKILDNAVKRAENVGTVKARHI